FMVPITTTEKSVQPTIFHQTTLTDSVYILISKLYRNLEIQWDSPFRIHRNLRGCLAGMASAPAQQPSLTIEQARVVLSEVIQAFSVPENAARMEEARQSACNDMGKMLQLVLPVATQIQQEVIKAYGFNNEGEGVLKFARLVKMYESQDPEIAAMSVKLKSLLLPPLSTPPIGGGIPAS
ncbi:hypothetical protein NFI96_011127, partial [Prochilodus magdalenae]